MTAPLVFVVPGPAIGKGRPRVGKVGNHARLFTPPKTVNYEGLVALAAAQAMQGRPLIEGPVAVSIDISCQIPESWSRRKKQDAVNHVVLPTTKPDIDNVEKALFDAMNGVVWVDDVQVVNVSKRKRYAATPGVRIAVMPALGGDDLSAGMGTEAAPLQRSLIETKEQAATV